MPPAFNTVVDEGNETGGDDNAEKSVYEPMD